MRNECTQSIDDGMEIVEFIKFVIVEIEGDLSVKKSITVSNATYAKLFPFHIIISGSKTTL